MSSATIPAPARTSVPSRGTTVAGVIRSEWTKLWSVRSTRWTLLATVVPLDGTDDGAGGLIVAVLIAVLTSPSGR